jgi:hypothetical protein
MCRDVPGDDSGCVSSGFRDEGYVATEGTKDAHPCSVHLMFHLLHLTGSLCVDLSTQQNDREYQHHHPHST